MKKFFLVITLVICSNFLFAQTPTFCDDIAAIFYQNCTNCHRPGNIAPFPLITYNDAINTGYSLADAVSSHRMPPWPPSPGFNRLAHERLLSNLEIQKINDWITGGMPEGNIANLPALPNYPNGSQVGTPDDVIQLPNYTITVTEDDYRCFVVATGYSANQMMKAVEFIPGNKSIVHHVLIYWDTTGVCQQLDIQDPNPGYEGLGGGVGNSDARLIGAWVPGSTPFILPLGLGIDIPANADIVAQFHYAPGSNGLSDSSVINFFFQSLTGFDRPVFFDAPLNHVDPASLQDWPLIIQANTVKTFHEQYQAPLDLSFLGVAPHMHLIGKTINAFGVTPTFDTIPMIEINDWDFHWQGLYQFRNVLKIPNGTMIYSVASYDNTSNNEHNPNNPPQLVTAGESTLNEMMITFFEWTIYLPGDENIVIDNSPLVDISSEVKNLEMEESVLLLYPNPATNKLITEFTIPESGNYSLEIKDVLGRTIKQLFPLRKMETGNYRFQYSIGELQSGNYFVELNGNTCDVSKLIICK